MKQLRRGDLVLIRDASKDQLQFFGYGRICGDVFDHDDFSPFRDFLWHDEIRAQRVIYPLRVAIDTKDVPKLALERVSWSSLDALGFRNADGRPLTGQQAWGKKLIGNFIETPDELRALSVLLNASAA